MTEVSDKMNEAIVVEVINFETDKYTNRASDGGGPTKYGITGRTLRDWRRSNAMHVPTNGASIESAIQALSRKEAVEIYINRFIKEPRFAEINNFNLRHLVVDTGVLHGRRRAARWLQRVVEVKTDGFVGPNTLDAINWRDQHGATEVYKKLLARRYTGFADYVQSQPSQLVFLEGWVNRANYFLMKL